MGGFQLALGGQVIISGLLLLVVAILATYTWLKWTFVNLEGAGRKVFVGIHGRSGRGCVYPQYLQTDDEPEKVSFFISPFMRPYAFVNPDRDEVRIKVTFAPEGSPSSVKGKDEPIATLRISWTIPDWVPFYDIPGDPGDHGRMPRNLRLGVDDVDSAMIQRFEERKVWSLMPVTVTRRIYPGAAAVTFMNKYTEGEHLSRMFEFVNQHARALLASFSVQELMRVKKMDDDDASGDPNEVDFKPVIRGRQLKLGEGCLENAIHEYYNLATLEQAINSILTVVCQLELEPYGVFINDINIARLQLPERLIEASRGRESKEEDKKSMEIFTEAMVSNLKKVTEEGMTPDIAGLMLADSVGTESRPGPLAALLAFLKKVGG